MTQLRTSDATIEYSTDDAAIAELEKHTAEWIPGACSVATVLREICEEFGDYVVMAAERMLADANT